MNAMVFTEKSKKSLDLSRNVRVYHFQTHSTQTQIICGSIRTLKGACDLWGSAVCVSSFSYRRASGKSLELELKLGFWRMCAPM